MTETLLSEKARWVSVCELMFLERLITTHKDEFSPHLTTQHMYSLQLKEF